MDQDARFQLEHLRRIAAAQVARRDAEGIKYLAILLVGVIALQRIDALAEPWRITTQILLGLACTMLTLLLGVTIQHVAIPQEREALLRQIQREESRSILHFRTFRGAASVVILLFLIITAARSFTH